MINLAIAGLMLLITISITSIDKVYAAENFSSVFCDKLNDPNSGVTKGQIVTITEERIGKEDPSAQYTVIDCFRETDKVTEDGKDKWLPKYVYSCTPNDNTICQPIQVYLSDNGQDLLFSYVGTIYRWSAGTIGIVTVLYLVVGGIQIAAAGGDSSRIEKAKERIMQSIAGLVLLFLSALILYTINPNFFTR